MNPFALLSRERGTLPGTTLATRLKAIYGDVENLDAFVGMGAEEHVDGASFGPLQLAIWRRQFTAIRDGDRFYYERVDAERLFTLGSDGAFHLAGIELLENLADLIVANTDLTYDDLPASLFHLPAAVPEPGGVGWVLIVEWVLILGWVLIGVVLSILGPRKR